MVRVKMTNFIPEDVINEVRQSVNIVEVISDYVQLKKQGKNYFGLCPFHGEKTPSFSVSEEKQIYHCFGCGAGGNVFSFLMEIEGYSFTEALQQIAKRTNIALPEVNTSVARKTVSPHKSMYEAHQLLAKLYHHILMNTEEGEVAKQYLIKERQFTEEMLIHFQLGYAPDSFEFATTFLERRGFVLAEMEKAGLLSKNESGHFYDRFRHRVMFPIFDIKGQVIAFGARSLGDAQPKYLNSPETDIFHKGHTLYHLNLARPAIRKKNQLILFEGYMDVIAAYDAGVGNSVASLGTSLTEEHAKMIRRLTDQVIICYDRDQAGVEATLRASEILEAAGCFVKIAKLPDDFDPDDYIQTFGKDRFQTNVVGDTETVMAFKMDVLRKNRQMNDDIEKMQYIDDVLHEISRLKKAVEREYYLKQLSEEFSISLEALKKQHNQIHQGQKKSSTYEQKSTWKPSANVAITKQKPLIKAYQRAERTLIAHMLKSSYAAYKIQEAIGGAFNTSEHAAIAANLYAFYEEGHEADLSLFLGRLNNRELEKLVTDIAMEQVADELNEEAFQDYVKVVLNEPKKTKIKEKERELIEAEKTQNIEQATQILQEIWELEKELGVIK